MMMTERNDGQSQPEEHPFISPDSRAGSEGSARKQGRHWSDQEAVGAG